MKIIAAIWMASLLLMSAGLHLEKAERQEISQEICAHSCCQPDEDSGSESNGHQDEQDCFPGCGCGCFQITVFDFQFMILPGIPVQHYDYGDYINIYHFEFSTPLFEPPRIG